MAQTGAFDRRTAIQPGPRRAVPQRLFLLPLVLRYFSVCDLFSSRLRRLLAGCRCFDGWIAVQPLANLHASFAPSTSSPLSTARNLLVGCWCGLGSWARRSGLRYHDI
ncbi:uncharacterized protein LAESUDRAFT_57895 [Laetiporus sulphureus 93-53]|uniref:Uncharacterized protein n=1 Tax=Laetiporus sulphureus 93-53 TaxID=1314785 RepID=A0A165AZR2_9APHY|nr:uncharacterized protein LAESUDRAFT_57895 [Laetiporus sulphureus 93-53]KZS99957.1 hypothetical protein LAESUDRAFT_57895 [Laetiporus sulphureus 93-53]